MDKEWRRLEERMSKTLGEAFDQRLERALDQKLERILDRKLERIFEQRLEQILDLVNHPHLQQLYRKEEVKQRHLIKPS